MRSMNLNLTLSSLPIFALFSLLCVKNVLSLDFYLFEDWTNPTPILLFNASLGNNWSYSLDRSSEWATQGANKVLSIDSSSGILYLHRHRVCKVSRNPLEVKLVSRTHTHDQPVLSAANTSIIPLTLYFHGLYCNSESHRKLLYNRHNKIFQMNLHSSYFLSINNQNCLEKDRLVLNLINYIPSSLTHSICDITLESDNFKVDSKFHVRSSVISCTNSKEKVEISGILKQCSGKRIHFKVTMHTSKQKLSLEFNNSSTQKLHSRLKRATTSEPPVFPQTSYERSVPENQPGNFSVIHMTATDSDKGEAGKITYTLVSIRNALSDNMFMIDPISGLVKTTQALNREEIPEHTFKVIATDGSLYRKSGTASLIIKVEDENDNTPTFGESVYNVTKQENIPIMTTIITLRATDQDTGQNAEIRYSITEPASSSAFKIDPTSGSISTLKILNREETASYKLVIQAKDQAPIGKQRSSSATVNIIVEDENDNFPQFSQDSYTVTVAENLDVSSKPVIAQVSATDADEGRNKAITYSITGGNFGDTFYIDATTGEISVQKSLNYEQHRDFRLKIKASDNGEAAKTNSTTVWVRISDINDNAPYFESPLYKGTVLENEKPGLSVLTVQALDADSGDNQVLVYSIKNPQSALPFEIDAESGKISVKSAPDREMQETYSFIVLVQDKGIPPLSAEASVQITVRDVNDNSPVFSQKTFFITVSEDTPQYKQLIQVSATDADIGNNALLRYVIISGNNDQVFAIATETGIVSLAKKLDFKIQDRYILTVKATDQGERYDTAEVHINVTDINKHVPTFINAPYQMKIDENLDIGVSVGKVLATDEDIGENGRITYELLNGIVDFEINPSTGVITTRERLDTENQAAYSFDVKASDSGDPILSDIAGVTVLVTDVNDNAPQFDKASYKGKVSEAAYDGTRVLQVSASDVDQGKNAQVSYKFDEGSDGTRDFEIDGATGEIRVAQHSKIDREIQNNYTLSVIAYDGGILPLTSTVDVKIEIEDINDNAPVFASDEIIFLVSENKKIGSTVAVVEAVDPDEGTNAVVEYSFEGGLDADKFLLQKRLGEPAIILNHIDLDYESEKKEYEILLKASSGNLFSLAVVKIQVQDVNDNQPILKDFMIIFNNFIDHFPTAPIGRIPAFDPDVSDQDKLKYSFLAGNEAGFLHLNESSGEITLDPRLNSDVPRSGVLQVKVTDGVNEVRATCQLYVRLVTQEMLQTSVTIRLNNMTSSAFLSPLYMFFVKALAGIIPTDVDNVFVINVKNDTDVEAQILNVTVAVREKSIRVNRETIDVFYPAEYLREQIYLQRTKLANLSTLQVLPFDDNLCVQELCPYYERCVSWLNFGMAAPFITSDTMLFRPIYPDNGYRCSCPKGFTGMGEYDYLCDVEVDYCYSNPCNNTGVCERTEGGYTCKCHTGFAGKNCEINLSKKYQQETCPTDLCRPPSVCQPLIEGGFRCEDCPNHDHFNQFCQLTTRSFPKGSFLTFPSLKTRHRFMVQLKFATQQRDGLLFYNGRFNEKHDFIALEIVNGQVQFSFSEGAEITKVSPHIPEGVNDGDWHQVTVSYLNRTATVTVGEKCDTEISVRFGGPINYTCAARVTHELDPICAKPSKICHRFLDLTGPLQIGGLPTLPNEFQIQNKDFEGCIKDFYIDGELVDLNTSVANNGTEPGCRSKPEACKGAPCRNGGTCIEGWGSYMCKCQSPWGGKDCSQDIGSARKLSGDGYIYYNQLIPRVHFTWFNGISFRTRHKSGTLLYIVADRGETVHMELLDGYLVYTYTNSLTPQKFLFDDVAVNDGQWHDFETRWMENGNLIMLLDFGQRQKIATIQSSLAQKAILEVSVGAQKFGTTSSENHFIGCVKHARVGNTQNSILQRPDAVRAPEGCTTTNPCDSSPCPRQATCVDEWEDFSCRCPPGTLGPDCRNICTNFNPCQNMSNCHHPQGGSYECQCGRLQWGKYCENVAKQPCPAKWWGYPVCGPCDESCSRENGFNPNCHKTTGKCSCLANHYQPPGSSKCMPCNCYKHGSISLQCDADTGQCPCISGIIGKRCNQCASKYAEIRMDEEDGTYACRVDYKACPRIFSHNMWWDSKVAGVAVVQDCPNGAIGEAVRNCSAQGEWEEPDLLNCTSPEFLELEAQVSKIEGGELLINTFVAKTMVAKLADTTSSIDLMFGNDLNITLQILNQVLDYENSQSGLNLTSEQDSKYLTNLISALSDVFHEKHSSEWRRLNLQYGGTSELIVKLERYLYTLSSALELTSQESPQPYNIISDNIVLGVDTFNKRNFTGKSIPKYDNIVKNSMFDEQTNIFIPRSAIKEAPYSDFLESVTSPVPKAYVGYLMYRSLGDLLPKSYLEDVRVVNGRPMSINSPVFTLILRDNRTEVAGTLSEPVVLTFKQLQTQNRTSPQCVFWQTESGGHWSTEGCSMTDRYTLDGDTFVKCSCYHLTSFALLMDASDQEYIPPSPVSIEIITFICLIVSMGCLVVTFLVLFCFKRLQSNRTTIHTNLVFVFFVCLLAFLVGVSKTRSELFCRLIAIALHYFFITGFSWLFVDILHIYRMLTEVRNIDVGTMKFYYLVAYVFPGIIVGLAVGLNTEGYGNDNFCWLKMSDKFIWSFSGPVTFAGIISVFMFVMAVKAFCREKISVTDITGLRVGLFANIIILMLWALIWVFGLLAVNYNITALHYLFAILCLALGVFVFFIYILAMNMVRRELKKLWYKVQGRKLDLDENIGGTRSSLYSRSALAYRHDSPDGGITNHINVGISTTSTTSKSTSRSSGGIYKGEDYLRSTNTSSSGNIPAYKHSKPIGLPPPYGYDPEKSPQLDDPDSIQIRSKPTGNDSDSDSEMSEGHASLDLASSHSSDEDDDMDLNWETQLPKNKKIEEAKEQARLNQQKEEEKQQQLLQQQQQQKQQQRQHSPFQSQPFHQPFQSGTPPPAFTPQQHGHWPGDPLLTGFKGGDTEYHNTDQPVLSSTQPDVTLQTPEYKGREFVRASPRPTDNLLNDSYSSYNQDSYPSPFNSPQIINKHSPRQHIGSPVGSPTQVRIPRNSPIQGQNSNQHSPREHFSSPVSSPSQVRFANKLLTRDHVGSPISSPSQGRMTVKVLTHRGSVSSDSECSHETSV